jgi:uncharacterized membrane protein YedE/YeeE
MTFINVMTIGNCTLPHISAVFGFGTGLQAMCTYTGSQYFAATP